MESQLCDADRVFREAARELAVREDDPEPIRVQAVDMGKVPWSRRRDAFVICEELLNLFNFLRELAAIGLYKARGWI